MQSFTVLHLKQSENAEYLFIQNFGKKAVGVPVREAYKVIYGKKNEIVEPLKTRINKSMTIVGRFLNEIVSL